MLAACLTAARAYSPKEHAYAPRDLWHDADVPSLRPGVQIQSPAARQLVRLNANPTEEDPQQTYCIAATFVGSKKKNSVDDKWCHVSCSNLPPNCPPELCECVISPEAKRKIDKVKAAIKKEKGEKSAQAKSTRDKIRQAAQQEQQQQQQQQQNLEAGKEEEAPQAPQDASGSETAEEPRAPIHRRQAVQQKELTQWDQNGPGRRLPHVNAGDGRQKESAPSPPKSEAEIRYEEQISEWAVRDGSVIGDDGSVTPPPPEEDVPDEDAPLHKCFHGTEADCAKVPESAEDANASGASATRSATGPERPKTPEAPPAKLNKCFHGTEADCTKMPDSAKANCVSLDERTTDDWCSITCANGDCPITVCKCKGISEAAAAEAEATQAAKAAKASLEGAGAAPPGGWGLEGAGAAAAAGPAAAVGPPVPDRSGLNVGPFDVVSGSKQEAAIAVADRDAQIAVMQMEHDAAVDAKRREQEGLGPAIKVINRKAAAAAAAKADDTAGGNGAGPDHRGGKSDVPGVAGLQIDAECGPTVGIKCGQTVFNNGYSADAGRNSESDAAAARAAAAKVAEADEEARRQAEARARTAANAGPARWFDQLRNSQAAGT